MIRAYSDHAANERTFLAWVRTGLAVIAFGFVIEKFNLFIRAIAGGHGFDPGSRVRGLSSFSGYDGFVLILAGIGVVIFAATRFVRTARLLDEEKIYTAHDVRAEAIVSIALIALVLWSSTYLLSD